MNTKRILSNASKYSYGLFLQNNPNASKKERYNAIKRFLDFTRGKPINEKKISPKENIK
jgi:hypothetical protein